MIFQNWRRKKNKRIKMLNRSCISSILYLVLYGVSREITLHEHQEKKMRQAPLAIVQKEKINLYHSMLNRWLKTNYVAYYKKWMEINEGSTIIYQSIIVFLWLFLYDISSHIYL